MGLEAKYPTLTEIVEAQRAKEEAEQAAAKKLFKAASALAEQGVNTKMPGEKHWSYIFIGTHEKDGEVREITLELNRYYEGGGISIKGAGFAQARVSENRTFKTDYVTSKTGGIYRLIPLTNEYAPSYSTSGTFPKDAFTILAEVKPDEKKMGELRARYSALREAAYTELQKITLPPYVRNRF